MSSYTLQFPNDETPEAKALLRYLNELSFVQLVSNSPSNEPVFIRPAEEQRQQAVDDMLNFLKNRPQAEHTLDEVVGAISVMRNDSLLNE